MSTRARRRPAFTMIEIMVGMVVAAVLMGVLFQLFNSSRVVNQKVEGKTEAIQSANLAMEAIKRDLRQLVTRPFLYNDKTNTYTGVVGDPQHPVLISKNGTEMSFHVPDRTCTSPDPASHKFKLATVYYGVWQKAVQDGGHSATVYHLVRCEGSNPTLAQEAGNYAMGGINSMGAALLKPGTAEAGKASLPPVRYRLLGPNPQPDVPGAPSATAGPGNTNYYVEVTLFGTDSEGREEEARVDLVALDEPSRLANVTPARVDEFNLFEPNPAAPLFLANLPPGTPLGGLPINLPPALQPPGSSGTPTNPGTGSPTGDPTNPGTGNPANPNDPNNPNSPTNPGTPVAGPTGPGAPGTPTTPGSNPTTTPSQPATPASVPPGVDPLGTKSYAIFTCSGKNGSVSDVRVECVLRNNGTFRFSMYDNKTGKLISEQITAASPQANGQNSSKEALDTWLTQNGIDPKSVPNDPTLQPPADYND